MTEDYAIRVCASCIALLANGDVGDYGEMPATVRARREDRHPNGIEGDDDHLYDRPGDDRYDNPTTRHADKIAQQWPPADGWHLVPGDEFDEFTWSQCEGCGSRLGGSRHGAHAFRG